MYILGISAFYHDSAAALIKDGEVLYAAQEERFSRIKNDSAFPNLAIKFLLEEERKSLTLMYLLTIIVNFYFTFIRPSYFIVLFLSGY